MHSGPNVPCPGCSQTAQQLTHSPQHPDTTVHPISLAPMSQVLNSEHSYATVRTSRETPTQLGDCSHYSAKPPYQPNSMALRASTTCSRYSCHWPTHGAVLIAASTDGVLLSLSVPYATVEQVLASDCEGDLAQASDCQSAICDTRLTESKAKGPPQPLAHW
jgi:hypothetical protein